MLAINIANGPLPFYVSLDGVSATARDEFKLTAPSANLTSTSILLNGVQLEATPSGEIPAFAPYRVNNTEPMLIDALSYGFFVLPDAAAEGCL